MHHFQDRFSPIPSHGRSALAGCDLRVRLILAVAAILAVVLSDCIWFGLVALGVSVAALAATRPPFPMILHRLLGPLILAALVFLTQAFLTGTTPAAEFDLGRYRLTATREGLQRGGLIASRILGSLGMVTLLCRNASMPELAAALRWARVPNTWIEIALLMHRYLHVFAAQAACVVSAQKIRLGYSRFGLAFRSAGTLAGLVVLRSLDQAERTHEAMIARGYRGSLPLPSLPPLPRSQTVIAGVGVTMIVAAYALAERFCS
jgi:cobalt/nickel transport system permease protein